MRIDEASWSAAGGFAICLFLLTAQPFSWIRVQAVTIPGAILFALLSIGIGLLKSRPRILAPLSLALATALTLFGAYVVNSFWPG
jgi:hypothetical protein